MEYLEQLGRVRRALKKFADLSGHTPTANVEIPADEHIEYQDALYTYFQHCWHLKDWIRNDDEAPASLKAAVRRMDSERDRIESLMFCADIANRSKHLKLTRSIRVDARTQGQIMLRIAENVSNSNPSKTSVAFCYQIVAASGTKYDALDLARKALSDWESLITTNGGAI